MQMEQYDIAIIGCGPAGMSAALNAKIRNKRFVLLGTHVCAGKVAKAPQIDNYLGFPAIKGEQLLENYQKHLKEMEIEVEHSKITNIYPDQSGFGLVGKDKFFKAMSLIICTGVAPVNLIPGEAEMVGKGAGYCATCDGPLYRNKNVAIIAYNKDAEEEANFLAGICREVIYIPQYKDIGNLDAKVVVKPGRPRAILGEETVTHVELDEEKLPVDGVFILRETMPAEQLLQGLELKDGAIVVDREMAASVPGVFAAGDCTGKPYQLAKAVGEGATAALSAVKYLDNLNKS